MIDFSWKSLLITVIGGVGLLAATAVMQMFFSTPPTRAEFNDIKAKFDTIDSRLNNLEKGQGQILDALINP